MEIDTVERERPSLGLILERTPEVISVPRSSKRVELKMGNGNGMLTTNLGVVWKLLRPSWCPHPHASLIEEVTERESHRQSLESHRKLDEIRRFYNKKFEEKHDAHRNLASSGEYLKPNKRESTSMCLE